MRGAARHAYRQPSSVLSRQITGGFSLHEVRGQQSYSEKAEPKRVRCAMRLMVSRSLHRYRRKGFKFQQTFVTPLKDLTHFTDAIMGALPLIRSATAVLDQVVFEPQYQLQALYHRYSLPLQWDGKDIAIEAQGEKEAGELLSALLSEWIDFLYIPDPARFVIYADHDEYITFFSNNREDLSHVIETLVAQNYSKVEYERRL
jgi:hypothetical protein